MKVDVTSASWHMDSSGAWLSLKVESAAIARHACAQILEGKTYTADIKESRKKRSINANSYMWALCTEIAKALSKDHLIVSKEAVYRDHVKTSGVCEYLVVPEKGVDSFLNAWSEHGTGWFAEVVDFAAGKEMSKCKKVCVYYGSSTYDTSEMSRLLESVIQEAENLGIDTLTERERSLLIDEWTKIKAAGYAAETGV